VICFDRHPANPCSTRVCGFFCVFLRKRTRKTAVLFTCSMLK
jgi:hypothetical protein